MIKLPNRRYGLQESIVHIAANGNPQSLTVTVNLDNEGKVREVFCANPMKGSDMEAILTDGCILISLCLQAGIDPQYLVDKLSDITTSKGSTGPAASPLGAVARVALSIATELGRRVLPSPPSGTVGELGAPGSPVPPA